MRLVGIVVALLLAVSPAVADDKALKPYAGKIVVSPDPPPTVLEELPKYMKMYIQDDDSYDVRKGPPWHINIAAVLTKDPGAKKVQLVFADKADKKLKALDTLELSSKRKVVLANVDATIAAGYAANKTYVVRILLGKTVLAKAEITLKD
jgi:hypothetical protein